MNLVILTDKIIKLISCLYGKLVLLIYYIIKLRIEVSRACDGNSSLLLRRKLSKYIHFIFKFKRRIIILF